MALRRRTLLGASAVLAVGAVMGPTRTEVAVPFRRGVNAAGADFGEGRGFDGEESFEFYASRGHRLVRLPFLWESVQPRLGQELDGDYLDRLQGAVSACTTRGMVCILDVHNYARYAGEVIGGGGVTSADLADLWVRLADVFGDDELVELALMNEPHDTPDGAPGWEAVAQEAVTAIRGTGAGNVIWVAGEQWSSAASWADTHPTWWIDDPLGRSGPEGHYYFDAANLRRGTYPGRYADDESAAVDQGFDSLRHKVLSELGGFVEYCRRHRVRGLVGEIGWPNDGAASAHPEDAASWNALGQAAYRLLDAGGLDVTYWAAGEQWNEDYNLSVYTGAPQRTPTSVAPVVEAHPSRG
jgi:endoglucanase